LLVLFVFTIPWEYSLDFGAPWGNLARIIGLVLLAAFLAAVFQAGSMRTPALFHALVFAFFLWLCCSCFWSIDPHDTASHLPGYFQEMMIVWFLWELIETRADLRMVLLAYVAGAWILAILTIGNLVFPGLPGQVRFVPEGQDPNDVARFLVMALPMAAWLVDSAASRASRTMALAFLPVGSLAILLTASRSGFLAGVISLAGCAVLLRRHARTVIAGAIAAPLILLALWLAAPHDTLLRLASIPEQLLGGDLNQRWNIWAAGWSAFARAPLIGSGADSFVLAAGLAPGDTAHNTALALATEGGLIALGCAAGMLILCINALRKAQASVRLALGTALAAWLFVSLVSNVQQSRTTWLLLGIIPVAGRFGSRVMVNAEAFLRTPPGRQSSPQLVSGAR
jgi:O-antigen ligase